MIQRPTLLSADAVRRTRSFKSTIRKSRRSMIAFIPYGGYWATPFARWQGELAHLHSMEFAAHVTKGALKQRNISPNAFDFGAYGMTVPQKSCFYGLPWFGGMIGADRLTGPTNDQSGLRYWRKARCQRHWRNRNRRRINRARRFGRSLLQRRSCLLSCAEWPWGNGRFGKLGSGQLLERPVGQVCNDRHCGKCCSPRADRDN